MARNFTGLASVMAQGGYRTYMAGKVRLEEMQDDTSNAPDFNFFAVGRRHGHARPHAARK